MKKVTSNDNRRVPTPEGIERLAELVAAVASAEAAAVIAVIATMWSKEARTDIALAELANAAALGEPLEAAKVRLVEIDGLLRRTVDLPLVEEPPDRSALRDIFGDEPGEDPVAKAVPSIRLSAVLIELLSTETPTSERLDETPVVDDKTRVWVDTSAAKPTFSAGLHLAMRCCRDDAREFGDLAKLLQEKGVPVHRIGGPPGTVFSRLLRATLHKRADAIVLIETNCLVSASGAGNHDQDWDEPDAAKSPSEGWQTTAFADGALRWIQRTRGVHIWRVPAGASLPKGLAGFIGGSIGPIRYDRAWRRELVRRRIPGLGDAGADALLSHAGDPRDVGAMVEATTWLARDGRSLEEAAMVVAGSMSNAPIESAATMPMPRNFDRRLLVCDEEALVLLDRAKAAAKDGARVLCWGPPGGGKSTYVQALAARMASESKPKRDVIVVTPALILARGLGATERIMEAIWGRAAGGGGILVVDELDAMCGVRDPDGASSGNAYLVRTLTDQWLRCFDLHPGVSVLATCNDPNAVDPAQRRRFAFVLEFGDVLSPEQERLAWRAIAEIEAPAG